MNAAILHDRLQAAFFRWGWLTPAALPLSELGGRGLVNTLAGCYALWGLLSIWSRRKRLDRAVVLLYLALLGAFLLTVPGAVDPARGVRMWLEFLMHSLALLLIQAALRESPANSARLLKALALFGALTLGGVYGLFPYYALGDSGQPFDPTIQLREDNLPFLLILMLGWINERRLSHWRSAAMAAATLLVLAYVVIAEGRAALLGLIVGLAVFCGVVLEWRLYRVATLMALLLAVSIALHTQPFRKAELDRERPLDAFTAGRTILWRQALAHPPARPWLGIGIGNGAYAQEVLRFEIGGDSVQVKHLHNAVLDAWYETGLLGVSLWLGLIGVVLGRLAWRWRRLSADDQRHAGVWLAAASALLVAGMLSFSYTSRQLAGYLFVCLGALSVFSAGAAKRSADDGTNPDTH